MPHPGMDLSAAAVASWSAAAAASLSCSAALLQSKSNQIKLNQVNALASEGSRKYSRQQKQERRTEARTQEKPCGTESVQSCIVLAGAWRIPCGKTLEKYSSREIRHGVPYTPDTVHRPPDLFAHGRINALVLLGLTGPRPPPTCRRGSRLHTPGRGP